MAHKQERSRETEAALIRAAMKLSMTKDTSKVTVREICAAAGVSVGAFYHHFESRQELFTSAYKNFDHELNRHMELRCQNKEPLQALTDLLMFQIAYVSREAAGSLVQYFCAILTDSSHGSVSPDRTYYRYTYDCVQRLADAGMLRPECNPQKIAELCISFVRGCLLDWTLHNQNYDVVEHMRSILPILFRGFLLP